LWGKFIHKHFGIYPDSTLFRLIPQTTLEQKCPLIIASSEAKININNTISNFVAV
jgi:hypothetical protein